MKQKTWDKMMENEFNEDGSRKFKMAANVVKEVSVKICFNADEINECGQLLGLDANKEDDLIEILRELYFNAIDSTYFEAEIEDKKLELL